MEVHNRCAMDQINTRNLVTMSYHIRQRYEGFLQGDSRK